MKERVFDSLFVSRISDIIITKLIHLFGLATMIWEEILIVDVFEVKSEKYPWFFKQIQ